MGARAIGVVLALCGLIWIFMPASLRAATVDQGAPGAQGPWLVSDPRCYSGTQTTLPVDAGTVSNCPLTQLTSRRFVIIRNSPMNSGSPFVIVRFDGFDPTDAGTSAGDVLEVGASVTYYIPSGVVPRCIATADNTLINVTECR